MWGLAEANIVSANWGCPIALYRSTANSKIWNKVQIHFSVVANFPTENSYKIIIDNTIAFVDTKKGGHISIPSI